MKNFLENLFSYEYFGMYLMIALCILIVLFLIVLFFGKKDQKTREIEATKRLQQVGMPDAFREEDNKQKVEVEKVSSEVETKEEKEVLENTIVVPNVNEIPKEKIEKIEEKPVEEDLTMDIPKLQNDTKVEEPILEREEERPITFGDVDLNIESELPKVNEDNIKNTEVKTDTIEDVKMEVPTFNFDELVKEVGDTSEEHIEEVKEEKEEAQNNLKEVFSSVYIPDEEKSEVSVPSSSDLDMELPTLKKEADEDTEDSKEEITLTDFNLDDITGETYNINK